MAPYFANQSCDPFTAQDAQCVIGTYPQYSVRVATAQQVSRAIDFAKKRNIRFVIRNTGHDYNGKSTGAGSLAVWTHHLKSMSVKDWSDAHYQGKAIKMGAGVQGFEVTDFASHHGLVTVGGECGSVGIAGGYTAGAGHSALASKYGLAADQTLEFEVIDGDGVYRVANRRVNTDLYWALSGGGGGTYAVVLALTVKAHQDIPVTGAYLNFTRAGLTDEEYYDAIGVYHTSLPAMVDSGIMSLSWASPDWFALNPLTAPGVGAEKLKRLLQPLTSKLEALGKSYNLTISTLPSYREFFAAYMPGIDVGVAQYGGWFIPRSAVYENNTALMEAYKGLHDEGVTVTGVGLNVSRAVAGDVHNAVNPAWRDTLIDIVIATKWSLDPDEWSSNLKEQTRMTEVLMPKLHAVAPDTGAYINEPDWRDPEWKKNFYGANYDDLLAVKMKYDPDHLFYGNTAVGSDYWVEHEDKRLCRA